MLLGHCSYLLNSSKVVQHSTLFINHDKFYSELINSFSRKLYSIEHGTPYTVELLKNLTEGQKL